MKRVTRNMYLYDVQFKLLHLRIATNGNLFKMKTLNYEECEYCVDKGTVTHAFLTCERAVSFWREVTIWLQNLGYHNFRLEQEIVILGDHEKDKLFNLSILVGKRLIYMKIKEKIIHTF